MLGSFYEKAWDFGRESQSSTYSLIDTPPLFSTKSGRKAYTKSSHIFKKMHLPQALKLDGGELSHVELNHKSNGLPTKHDVEHDRNTIGDFARDNEILVQVPSDKDRELIVDTAIASWILLVQRYQRDTFLNFTWGLEGAANSGIQIVAAQELNLTNVSTVTDLITTVHNIRSKDIAIDQPTGLVLVFNDGTKDEWTYQVTIQVQPGQLRASSQWQLPTMAKHQAVSQLHNLSSILDTLFQQGENQPTSDLLDISKIELDEIWRWNHPLQPALETCMHEIVSEQAQLNPEKYAVEAWDGALTYAQVDQYSTELAQNLLLLDEEQPIIPLLFEKSRWTVVSVLAVMKAGKCFALLDPAQPEGRLRTIVEQTDATLVIASKAQAALAIRVASSKATIVPISESKFSKIYSPFAVQQPKTTLPAVSPSAALYIQFTSGSTGKPKGCIISHSQYTSGAIPRAYDVGYRSHSRVLDFASYAFDVCIDSMLCTLAHGGTLCTPSDEQRMNDLSNAMRELKVTLAGMTPSVARTLDVDILDQLESIALGGEGVSASDASSWGKKTKVVNAYGPSECTVGATINENVGAKPYITMGKGKGCATWVVDPTNHNKLVPIGAVGELLIEGPIVGIGYLNNPEKTNEVFINDPAYLVAGHDQVPGRNGRLYKTGDLVRYDPDGNGEVIFVGRQDQQVKLRGQRVELSEIEYNMQKHLPSDTLLATEVIKPGGNGDQVLVAFLVEQRQSGMRHLDGNIFASFSTKFQKSLNEMTQHLFQDLPGYMVPSAYIPLWKMPLLVSCKTDRKRLREIGTSVTRQDLRRFSAVLSEKIEATTEMELALRPLWAKVLGGESDFGANDNFFSMGGDSLRAMRLVAAARNQGISLSVPDIMLNPTLSAMANKAKSMGDGISDDVPAFSILPSDWSADQAKAEVAPLCNASIDAVEDVYLCTPLQEGLMALSAKFTDAYVAQRVVELPLDVARNLAKAFHKTITDSAILRTRIVNVPGRGLFQVVVKNGHYEYEGDDLQAYLERDRAVPMDLGSALFRCALITPPGSDKGYIVVTLHHAVYDGWSFPLVVERVNRAYVGKDTPRPAQFKHFIRHLAGLDRSVAEKYWSEHLRGVSPHQFPPLPHKGYTMKADSLLEHYVKVPTSAHSQTTLATIIRGAWALVSSLYMGHSDIVFGETLTGRSAAVTGIEQIEGPMITTLPIRVRLNLDRTVSQFLHDVHALTIQQIPHEHLGLQNIRRLSPEARHACELKTGLVLHPKEDEDWGDSPRFENAPANAFVPSDDSEAAKEALKFNTYALMLVCTLDADGFLIMASFDSNCISSPIMEKVLGVLDRIVTKFCGNPEHLLGDVAVLDSAEKQDAEKFKPQGVLVESSIESETISTKEQEAPQSEVVLSENEEVLRNILARILNIAPTDIRPSDSFFELGGDSIGAMRLVSDARVQGLNLTVAQIFQSRSLASLAASIGFEKVEKLRSILGRILGLPKEEIKASDSFFELGGDSIGAMRLVSDARVQGLNITVAQVFQSKSLSSLASVAEQAAASNESEMTVDEPFAALGANKEISTPAAVKPLLENQSWKVENIYPTRPLQQLAVEGTVDLPRYSLRYELIHFTSSIDEAQLLSSCQALVARNEVLRTVFVSHSNQILGVVLETLRVPFEQILIPEGSDILTFAHEFTTKDIQAPKPHGSSFVSFTLLTSPSSSESILVFRISHAQYDEICLPILYQQLAALYSGNEIPETEPFSKHINHVVAQNIPQSIPYWKNLLTNSQMSFLKPTIPLTNRKVMDVYREFDISSRPSGITIGSLPTAAWAIVLANRLATRDVVFGEVVSGRNIGVSGADRIFGPTWQYIPFRVPFKPTWTHLDLLKFVQEQHVESASYEGMGLSEIIHNCTDWDPKAVTWFDTVVHQAPEWVESMDFGGLDAKFEVVYPHSEPLREWKCQAFVKDGGRKLGIEIVTFEEWGGVAEEVLGEVGSVLEKLIRSAGDLVFEGTQEVVNSGFSEVAVNGEKESLEDFEGVM
ncbi:nonribosomal peptide synthetase 6 [Dendryphion nanum]|uniref:Nonribosomal peptide synthetase 6 n=1 Tax=Dendryphion nanum TaxID=256645 RepID=A0A9P9E9W4_9PLEO|nr:nonribosomal peptide synthetase 6 [Dendryphion nanum]